VEHLQNSQDLAKSRHELSECKPDRAQPLKQCQASANLRDIMIDSERYHALVLRAWEATNIERDLRSIMGAVAEVLAPYAHPEALVG